MTTIYKLLDTEAKAVENTGSGLRQVEVICSTSSPDRIGDVIVQEGINLTSYKKNPVVLWGHDSDRPVARADKVFIQNGQLRAIAEFPPAGEDQDADWVYSKVKNKLVNAVSIGFIPKEWEPVDNKNPWDGYKYVESEMVEFSFVAVPMNAEALIVGRSFLPPKQKGMTLPSKSGAAGGTGQTDDNSQLTTEHPDGGEPDTSWMTFAAKGLDIHDPDSDQDDDTSAGGDTDGDYAPNQHKDMMMAAHGWGTESVDTAGLRRGFLLHDASSPDKKKSYQLPFGTMKNGAMVAHKAGLEHAAGKLARTDGIDEKVRAKAMNVVDHYRDRITAQGKSFVIRAGEWKVGGSRDLPLSDGDGWDGPAAAKRMFDAAGFEGDSPNTAKARKGFLIYDSADPTLKGSYKLPFADIVDGELKAVKGGIRAAASRLPQTDAPADVLDHARGIIDHYEKRLGSDTEDGKALIEALHKAYRALDEASARVRKAGRVLNSANEERLRTAHASIGEVLDMLPPVDESSAAPPKGATDETASSKADGSQTLRFPRRAKRELELLKLRSA